MSDRPGPLLLAQCALGLVRASLTLRAAGFETVMSALPDAGEAGPCPPAIARRLGRALDAWERRVPWRWKCFEKGLAAHRWLSARGYASTVHYGARRTGPRLEAHVWVTSGGQPVVGCSQLGTYAELRRFP